MDDTTDTQPILTLENLARVRSNIRHVFVLMLENRSFDHVFARSNIPGIQAATSDNGNLYEERFISFQGNAPDTMPSDPGHEFQDVVEQLCGKGTTYSRGSPYPNITNAGFVDNYATSITEGPSPPPEDVDAVMRGLETSSQTPSLYQLATEFILCDAWHSSLPGPTWPNRYFVHGASSANLDASPTSSEIDIFESVDGFSYPRGSIYDALGSGNYRLYQDESGNPLGRIPQVSSIKGISFFDVHNLADFEADLSGDYPYRYTFIEPSYGDVVHGTYEGGSSQHPMNDLAAGDRLVASVYNTLRNSPLWVNSLLVVTYDEHGGFYDSVAPGKATPPNDGADGRLNRNGFDFSVYGVRVPALVISPWVDRGRVEHTLFDHSSIPATLERLFGLQPLTDRDKAANDILPMITSTCRTDCPLRI